MATDDKARNKKDEVLGKAKERYGDATDDKNLQAEGRLQRIKGGLKQAGEKVKDAFK
ncbi:MAG TPA: CsbD family protein [Micromonosporaceae bacterium]